MCKRRFGLIGAALGAVLLLASSCGKSASQSGDSRLQATTSIDADGTLTLPSMPDSIKDPTGRADYLAAHFSSEQYPEEMMRAYYRDALPKLKHWQEKPQ